MVKSYDGIGRTFGVGSGRGSSGGPGYAGTIEEEL